MITSSPSLNLTIEIHQDSTHLRGKDEPEEYTSKDRQRIVRMFTVAVAVVVVVMVVVVGPSLAADTKMELAPPQIWLTPVNCFWPRS